MKRSPLIVFFATAALLLTSIVVLAAPATVVRVKDGDTIVVSPTSGGGQFTCRLYGIDAPEIGHGRKPGQRFGEEAMRELKRMISGKIVEVELTGQKTYNREVCRILVNGESINLSMVRSGYAWAYTQYLKRPHASEYLEAEKEARLARRGLWADHNPTPPWEFRRKGKKL